MYTNTVLIESTVKPPIVDPLNKRHIKNNPSIKDTSKNSKCSLSHTFSTSKWYSQTVNDTWAKHPSALRKFGLINYSLWEWPQLIN